MSNAAKIEAEDPANRMVKRRSTVPPPRIERSLRLQFQGDWGRANLHRALGFLGYEFMNLAGPYTRFAIWNGRGGMDNVQAVGRGEVDVALTVPVPFMRMAMDGKGACAGESFPNLRALGYVPQHDRMIVALRRDLGIRSWSDLREKRPKLRITLGPNDGMSFIGIAGHMLLEAHGVPRAVLEQQGSTFSEHDEPRACTREMLDGEADLIIQEAVMTTYWQELADKRDLIFLPIEAQARDGLKAEFGLPTATLPKDYLRGMDREMEFLDFSHFMLLATTDLADDVAYALAWSLVERFETLEMQYRHIPPERSPVSYPIDPKAVCRVPIPLHPGAERYYRDAGHLS
jgi:TRAP-type uncharacterized transport system substrate-binding protein